MRPLDRQIHARCVVDDARVARAWRVVRAGQIRPWMPEVLVVVAEADERHVFGVGVVERPVHRFDDGALLDLVLG
jgi:hypothetical protein